MYSDRKGKVRKSIYFSDDEWKIIEEKTKLAKLQDTTKYIRKIAIEGEVAVYDFAAAHELIYEINKIGVNVNQVARKANELNSIYKSDIDGLRSEYENLCHMLNQFLLDLPARQA